MTEDMNFLSNWEWIIGNWASAKRRDWELGMDNWELGEREAEGLGIGSRLSHSPTLPLSPSSFPFPFPFFYN
ncbi:MULTISPECIES: hypothetical protein [Microcoleaceae]|uniref:hypothetical protein n=2 Tax=Microcoleaceae TaxID=1892252 RepID=UPI001881E30C|nr:hypothetical protein [Tychonema sp. LEGE 06208]MBE9161824.1 hypothetical protein [Tychonema sp. LEGE 06208]